MALEQQKSSFLLRTVNKTFKAKRQQECLHKLVEAQVAKTPDAVAVVFEAKHLTYAEVEIRANQLAHHLRKLGVQRGTLVGIFAERSVEMVIALYAALKAGAAYIPIDPAYPAERVKFMLLDAQAPVLLTQVHLLAQVPQYDGHVVALEADWPLIEKFPSTTLNGHETVDDLAYVIYTSGSTGQPKGAMNTHGGICNRLLWMQEAYGLQTDDRVLQKTPFSFDVSVWELFWPLLTGARLVMARPKGHRDNAYLRDLILREGITTLHFVPSMLHSFLQESAIEKCGPALRRVISSGEALTGTLQTRFFERLPTVELHNLYGPTEAAVDVTAWACHPDETAANVSIGRPITNIQVHVLGEDHRLLPVGMPGEMHIGGVGLARGYHRQPDLTAEKFIPDPLGTSPGGRIYKTGDLACYRSDGTLDYLGRVDHQVKIRGFRIELGEIEATLAKHPDIHESVLLAWEDKSGAKRLVAYVVVTKTARLTTTDLLAWLKHILPDHMLPSQFVFLEALPLTPNGKVDRKALPPPDTQRPQLEAPYVSPTTPEELALAWIWAQVLEVTPVGIHDNFFELGGDSIRAIQIVAHAQQQGMHLTLEDLFTHPTIQGLLQQLPEERPPALPIGHYAPFDLVCLKDRQKLPAGLEDAYPLTQLQIGMIYHNKKNPASAIFHDIFTYRIQYPFHHEKFQVAIDRLIKQHAPLRTSFDLGSFTQPLQLVHPSAELPIRVEDLQHLDSAAQTEALDSWIKAEKRRPFDPTKAPLLRILVHRYSSEVFQFIVSFHHLILDGWSLAVMLTDILQDYAKFLKGTNSPVPSPGRPYRNYVASELAVLAAEDSRDFWIKKMQAPDIQLLPRWPESHRTGGTEQVRSSEFQIPTAVFEGLKEFALSAKTPLKSILMAAHHFVMHVLQGQTDVISGLITNGRPEAPDGDRMIGLFLNTVPVRFQLKGGTWFELVQQIFQTERELMPHRRFPLSAIQQAIGVNMLFETAFNFVHFHVYHNLNKCKDLGFIEGEYFEANDFVLFTTFMIDIPTAQLRMHIDYDPGELCPEQIEAICEYYLNTLSSMASQPHARYEMFSPLPYQERKLLLEWNNTTRDYPSDKCLHVLFEEQVMRTPDAVALVDGLHCLSYRHLNQRANRLAHYLVDKGVGPDVLVGLCMERSAEMIVAMLAILKAGGAYVPLDPSYPKPWVAAVLENTQAPLLITQRDLHGQCLGLTYRVVYLDETWDATEQTWEPPNLPTGIKPDHLAYVLYTSGSTGQPKGVAIPHHGPVALIHWALEQFSREELAGVLAATSICFDLSVFELFVPLSCGGTIFLAENALALSTLPAASYVTLVNSVPSALRELVRLQSIPSSVRVVNLAGEPLRTVLVQQIYAVPGTRKVYDLYGPTEATTYSSVALRSPNGPDTIGRPIANEQIYLLDKNQHLVPVGVAGEILIGGSGLARGYHQRPDLTAEQFLPHPFGLDPGARIYRTGDLGRYRPDGQIEYLGRRDHQVKVRGFRIELGEIESLLFQHPMVQNAVALCREDTVGEKHLVAYVATQDKGQLSITDLRAFLQQKVPEYMIPPVIMVLDTLPLTPNGKIDREALPVPDNQREQLETPFVPPRTLEEELLAGMWTETLKIPRVGIHDNFYALGGHSLLATQIISKINSVFRVDFPIRLLFEHPTVADLAKQLAERIHGISQPECPTISPCTTRNAFPLSYTQERFWILDQLSQGYYFTRAFRLTGPLRERALQQSFQDIVNRHEIFRTTFPLIEGRPQQVISPTVILDIPIIELPASDEKTRESEGFRLLQEEEAQSFDLAQGPLLRVKLVRFDIEEYLLIMTLHHVICDGWAIEIFLGEFSALYRGYCEGQTPSLPVLSLQYANFTLWQRQLLETPSSAVDLAYWQKTLKDPPPPLPLPTDYPRPAVQTFRGGQVDCRISPVLTNNLLLLKQGASCTFFIILLAALQLLLSRYTGLTDIVIGAPTSGRNRREFEPLIGCFLNNLVLRNQISHDQTFAHLLMRVREQVFGALAHQEVPFEHLLETLHFERYPGRTPLFQVLLNMHNFSDQELNLPGVKSTYMVPKTVRSLFDWTFYFQEYPDQIHLKLVYNADLFSQSRMQETMNQLHRLLEQVAENPDRPLEDYSLVTEASTPRLPDPTHPLDDPPYETVCTLIHHQAEGLPTHPAVSQGDKSWSYKDLVSRTDALARTLKEQRLEPGAVVAIGGPRCFGLVVALLAVLQAGGVIMPLDSRLPPHRQRLMRQVAKAERYVWIGQDLPPDFPANAEPDCVLHRVDPETGKSLDLEDSEPVSTVSDTFPKPDDPAYLFFTSGTTGIPKGILGQHKSLSHFLTWQSHTFQVGPQDRVAQLTSLSFDAVLRDLFLPLISGSTLCLPDDLMELDPTKIIPWVDREGITILHTVPTVAQFWLRHASRKTTRSNLRWTFFSGEPVTDSFVTQWRQAIPDSGQQVNFYGSTETTLIKCWYIIPDSPQTGIQPIGFPMSHTQALILGPNTRLCGIGEIGEIVIRTPFRTLGYLNTPPNQQGAFRPNPYRNDPVDLFYWTGDRGRYRGDGSLEIMGRIDNQIKIRGVRIEPEEITTLLQGHPDLEAAAVLGNIGMDGHNFLVAYVVVKPQTSLTEHSLRTFLASKVPGAMIPSSIIFLDTLPYTPNGKLDRRALPAPASTPQDRKTLIVGPRTPLEEALVHIWLEILQIDQVGVYDNFFELGGHSLLAMQVISRFSDLLEIDLPLRTLFEHPTVAQLANEIESRLTKSHPDWCKDDFPSS